MAINHFEELWEQCESLHKFDDTKIESLINEIILKINLYKLVDSQTELPEDDRKKAKSRIFGEILLNITHLSLKDNINVFDALGMAAKLKVLEDSEKIPPEFRLPRIIV